MKRHDGRLERQPIRRITLRATRRLLMIASLALAVMVALPAQARDHEDTEEKPAKQTSPPPPAPETDSDTVPIEPTASIFSRYELRRGFDELGLGPPPRLHDDQDAIYYRTRFGLVVGPTTITDALDLVLRVVPQASGVWHVGGSSLVDAELGLHEGLMQLHAPWFRLDVGRFEMVYGDHFVIGNVGWHQTGRSFDGARWHVQPNPKGFWIDTFFTVLSEGFVGGAAPDQLGAGDTYFGGVYAAFGPALMPGKKFALDGYVLGNVTPEDVDPDTGEELEAHGFATVGVRSKADFGLFDYRAELGFQIGQAPGERDMIAYQGDVEVGLGFAKDLFRVALEGFFASGDDPGSADEVEGWNQLFPTAHKWLGFADIIGGRTNVAGGVLHLSSKVGGGVKIYVNTHLFARPEDSSLPDPADPTASIPVDSGLVGTEIDSGVVWGIGKGLKLRTNYSAFVPLEDAYVDDDPAHFYELELRYDY